MKSKCCTMQEAASQLGIGLSVLKRVCRAIGLARWPFRKRQSLRNVMEQTKLYLNVRPAPRPSRAFPSQSSPLPRVPLREPITELSSPQYVYLMLFRC